MDCNNDNRHLLFATLLRHLVRAMTWYMDGVFKAVNKPWVQLFTIHASLAFGNRMKQIPLVFVLMSGKSEEDYYTVIMAVDRLLIDRLVECFVAYFKTVNWLALKDRFPEVSIQGCAFH